MQMNYTLILTNIAIIRIRNTKFATHKFMDGRIDRMGLASCIALIVGACVGSAIFSISGITVWMAGPSAIISWVLAAAIFCAYGMIVTELAGRHPESGGIFMFPKFAFGGSRGKVLGFVSGWGYIVSNIVAIAFSAIYFGAFLKAGFPGIGSERLLSILSCIVATAIILPGGKQSQYVQNALVVILLAAMSVYCLTAVFGGCLDTGLFKGFFSSGYGGKVGFIKAVPLAIVAYGGAIVIAFVAGDVKEPQRNIPKALFIGISVVSIIYAAVIATVIGTIPAEVLDSSEELRLIPLLTSVSDGNLHSYPYLIKVISVCGSLALLTTMIALLRVNSRAIQAIAGEGLLPKSLTRENKKGTPTVSLLVMAVVCICLCFFKECSMQMISLGAVLNIISMTVTCLSLPVSRKKADTSGYKAPLGTVLPVLVIAIFIACYLPDILSPDKGMWIFTAASYAVGLVAYLISRLSGRH